MNIEAVQIIVSLAAILISLSAIPLGLAGRNLCKFSDHVIAEYDRKIAGWEDVAARDPKTWAILHAPIADLPRQYGGTVATWADTASRHPEKFGVKK